MILLVLIALLIIVATIVPPINAHQKKKKALKEKIEQNKNKELAEKELAYSKGFEKIRKSNIKDIGRHKKSVESLRTIGYLMEKSVYQEQKVDWAVQGGIASGLAGTGAGILAAASAIEKNAEIEEKNKAAREWGHQQNLSFQNMANSISKNNIPLLSIDTIKKTYEIITSWSPDTLFSYIKFGVPTVTVDSETKAIQVSVNWHQEDRSICIDGAIRAKIYDTDKKCVGCAYLAFPTEGTSNFKGVLSGICAKPSQTGSVFGSSRYMVELEPIDLWELGLKNLPSHKKTDDLAPEQHQKIVDDYDRAYNNELKDSALTNKDIKSTFKSNLLISLISSIVSAGILALIFLVIIPKFFDSFLIILLLPVCFIVAIIPIISMICSFMESLQIEVPYELNLVKSLSLTAHILLFILSIAAVIVLGILL